MRSSSHRATTGWRAGHRKSMVVDASVAGDIADDNRFEVIGERGSVTLAGWSRLACQGQTSEL